MSKKIWNIFKKVSVLKTFDNMKDGETVHVLSWQDMIPCSTSPFNYYTLKYNKKVFGNSGDGEYSIERGGLLYGTSKIALLMTIYYKYLK